MTLLFLRQFNTESYRSGHNGAVLKTVRAQVHRGSNPLLSAKKDTPCRKVGVSFCEFAGIRTRGRLARRRGRLATRGGPGPQAGRIPPSPPRRRGLYIVRDDFFYKKSSLIHSVAPPFQIEPAALGFDLVLLLL